MTHFLWILSYSFIVIFKRTVSCTLYWHWCWCYQQLGCCKDLLFVELCCSSILVVECDTGSRIHPIRYEYTYGDKHIILLVLANNLFAFQSKVVPSSQVFTALTLISNMRDVLRVDLFRPFCGVLRNNAFPHVVFKDVFTIQSSAQAAFTNCLISML